MRNKIITRINSPGGPGGPTDCKWQIELINQSTVNIHKSKGILTISGIMYGASDIPCSSCRRRILRYFWERGFHYVSACLCGFCHSRQIEFFYLRNRHDRLYLLSSRDSRVDLRKRYRERAKVFVRINYSKIMQMRFDNLPGKPGGPINPGGPISPWRVKDCFRLISLTQVYVVIYEELTIIAFVTSWALLTRHSRRSFNAGFTRHAIKPFNDKKTIIHLIEIFDWILWLTLGDLMNQEHPNLPFHPLFLVAK